MIPTFSQVAQFALALPQSDRAKLAGELLRSLDPQAGEDPQTVAEQWGSVILARSDALHRGDVQFVAGDKVISELRKVISSSTNPNPGVATDQ